MSRYSTKTIRIPDNNYLAPNDEDTRLKTEPDEPWPCLRGSKLLICPKNRSLYPKQLSHPRPNRKLSNFQILKRKMSYLDSGQLLGDKSPRQPLAEFNESKTQEKMHAPHMFGSSRQSFHLKVRRKVSKKDLSEAHLPKAPPEEALPPVPQPTIPKKRQSSQCAKKYFRPVRRGTRRQAAGIAGKQNSHGHQVYLITRKSISLI